MKTEQNREICAICAPEGRLEADQDFAPVSQEAIAEWRGKLGDRFEIGSGRLISLDGPTGGFVRVDH